MNARTLLPVAAVCALGLLIFFLRYDGEPPTVPDATAAAVEVSPAPQSSVDTDRLMETVSVLAHDSMRGRAPETPESAAVRAYLIDRLQSVGVQPWGGNYEHPFDFATAVTGTNVVGVVPGADERAIVLTAHFDHVGVRDGVVYNGADDNASGTAAVLEIAGILARSPLRHTLVVALFDAEEVGLQGARAFVGQETVPLESIRLNINLDMVSRSGGTLWAAGAHHTPALRPVLEAVAADAPTTLRLGHDRPNAPEGDDWTLASDHGPFHQAGVSFVYFGVEDHPDYHQPTDDVERIVPAEFTSSVETILSAIRALDRALTQEPHP